jgi:hypothetical protein
MLLKYGVEAGLIGELTGRFYSPIDFLNPLLTSRQYFLRGAPEWFGVGWLLWTLPFVAIAVVLTIRRAADAGLSPWMGLLILVPFVNILVMIALALVPSASERRQVKGLPPNAGAADDVYLASSLAPPREDSALRAVLASVALATAYAFIIGVGSIYALGSYGATLFYGTPIIAGIVAAYVYNGQVAHGWWPSIGVAMLPALCVGGLFLIFALEGVICLVMAAPIVLPMAALGGLLGKAIADSQRGRRRRDAGMLGCVLVLPLAAYGESRLPNDAEYVVETSVEVMAPPEVVWRNVVDFRPIDSPEPWLFHWGIAGPKSATIDGRGVGAIRRCNFTTGSFVEPITVWDQGKRLAFDVTEQPEPMFELSPYRHVHPPHLDGSFRSTRGEFVLEPLTGGRTRLVGRTWYRLELSPHGYWTVWTDWIIHRIHERVLEHIKRLAEREV